MNDATEAGRTILTARDAMEKSGAPTVVWF